MSGTAFSSRMRYVHCAPRKMADLAAARGAVLCDGDEVTDADATQGHLHTGARFLGVGAINTVVGLLAIWLGKWLFGLAMCWPTPSAMQSACY